MALLGAALALGGGISYMLLLDVVWIRSTAIPNLILMGVGTALCIRAALRPRRGWTMWLGAGGTLVTLLFVVAFFGLFRLPDAEGTPAVGTLPPDFTLADQDGTQVSLSSFRSRGPVLLVFYRGYW